MATVFYCWQSDLANATNRSFIERALRDALHAIRDDSSISIDPVIDRDTAGVPGAPDIAATIFAKIDAAAAVVCDVSLVSPGAGRAFPNPNVLIEFGYSLKSRGHERVVLVFNTASGEIGALPFDLRQRRVLAYHAVDGAADRAAERKTLSSRLALALRPVLCAALEPSASLPDIRVSASAALVGTPVPAWFIAASVQNHSAADLFHSSVVVELDGGESIFFQRDAVMRSRNGAQVIHPGDSYTFMLSAEEILASAEGKSPVCVVARDRIDRRFRSTAALGPIVEQVAAANRRRD